MADASIRVSYRIETSGDPEAMAAKIASDQSTGTFTDLPGETEAVRARCAARVEDVRPLDPVELPSLPDAGGRGPYRRAEVVIAYPLEAVGTDIAALMTIAVGGVFAVRGLTGLRVLDFDLPAAWSCHPGPQFGIEGSRRLMGVAEGPMIASIIKPSLGLLPEETAAVVRTLCEAGVDFIKDDEKLMSPGYSPLEARVAAIMPVIHDHEQRTGKRVMYAFGISSADPDTMMRNHDLVAEAGGNAAVVNINSIGHGGMSFLRKRSALCLHAHRNGWDLLTRHPGFGIDFRAYQKIWRLLGVDQFQINGIRAKVLGAGRELRALVLRLHDADLLARRPAAAGGLLRPVGRPGRRDLRTHRPHPRPHVPRRRRHPRPPTGPGRRRARHPPGLGRGRGRRPAGDLGRGPPRAGRLAGEVRLTAGGSRLT